MGIDWFTFAAQIINFLILLLLLRQFLYGPILSVMHKREQHVRDKLEAAKRSQQEAGDKALRYQQQLEELDRERERMVREAREQAERKKSALLEQYRKETEAIRARWLQTIEQEKAAYYEELYRQTGQRIMQIVAKIIDDVADSELEAAAVRHFLSQMQETEAAEWSRATVSALQYGEGQVMVVSSFVLSPEQKQQIEAALNSLIGREVRCGYEQSEGLGFGIEIRMGGWKMGWNALKYLRMLRDEMEAQTGDPDRETSESAV